MHRARIGALTAALALLLAALAVPRGAAPTSPASGVVASPVAAAVPSALVPVEFGAPSAACRSGLVALTFDDGPSASVTLGLVRTLKRLDVPATFFMVGSRVRSAPATARAVQRAGFSVANHTWSHQQLTALGDRAVRRELARTRREFTAQKLVATSLMRPPYGATNRRIRRDVRALGLYPVLWSIDSLDWTGGSPRRIAHRVIAGLRRHGTNVVLQHDGITNSPSSAKAVPLIVARARQLGYCFAALGPKGGVAPPRPVVRATALPGTEDGPAPVRIRLQLDRPTTRSVRVRLQTVSGSARAGTDFTPANRTVIFPRGVRTAWITVPVVDDDLVEGAEDLRVVLDRPYGVTLTRREVLATIFSDDG
ncbi:MAG: polysaccharide deacetylase family protein [Propionibacteriales bacterium]|nr:polysaccharide deacetylase family protein [Propionibacteriales bacterium]